MKHLLAGLTLMMGLMLVGCVSYRDAVVAVHDQQTGDPVEGAAVTVQWVPAFARLNAGQVPMIQSGTTDQAGRWEIRIPTERHGVMYVNKQGYLEEEVTITPDSFSRGELDVGLVAD